MHTRTPIGRFTRKIQCQSSTSVSTPPSSTPIAPPPEATNPVIPIAFARSAGSVKSVITSDRPTAEATAPPTPCTARATTSMPCVVESPQAREASVNATNPATRTARRPSRSAARPVNSRKPPNVSM